MLSYRKIVGGCMSGYILALIIVAALIGVVTIFATIIRLVLFIKYHAYKRQETQSSMTALAAARATLDVNGMQDVEVKKCGFFRAWLWGDSYSVRKKTVFLRRGIINTKSITGIGVAMQKVGLAIMDKQGDKKLKARSILLPISYISPVLFIPIVIIGFVVDYLIGFTGLPTLIFAIVGIVFYSLSLVYLLLNIPVEKKANRLAMGILSKSNILTSEEMDKVSSLLNMYVWMYVADFVISILKILYSILKMFGKIAIKNKK